MDRLSTGRVVLIRHAQASFGSGDYDNLSERGLQQAARLGAWLAEQDQTLVALMSGTMKRHAQTVAAIAAAFSERGATLPQCTLDSNWNEFDHAAVIRAYARTHPDDPQLLLARVGDDKRAMHGVLAAALHAWSRAELSDVPESWNEFSARVAQARARLVQETPDGTVIVVSSGGVIGRCAQAALGIDDAHTVALNLGLRNTGICEFRRGDGDWQMLTWNALPHFAGRDEREWVTYY